MVDNHFDHEQAERDYYDRESEKHLKGCLFSIKALALLTAIFLIGMMIFSCASQIQPATSSIGTVLQVDGDRVLVTFPVVTRELGSQSANWFYIPGHGYQVRDVYPDPVKDPNLRRQ